jgi:hypothetical protein
LLRDRFVLGNAVSVAAVSHLMLVRARVTYDSINNIIGHYVLLVKRDITLYNPVIT